MNMNKNMQLRILTPVDQYIIKSVADVDYNVFSDSDIEALDFAWNTFGNLYQYQLRDITHEYPEWKKQEQVLEHCPRMDMDSEDFLDDPVANIEKCYELDREGRWARCDQLREAKLIEALWN